MLLFQRNHIDMICMGTKTQTRRLISRYKKGAKKGEVVPSKKVGSIQQCRVKLFGVPHCHIRITRVWQERLGDISKIDAHQEGGYSPDEYIAGLIEMHNRKLTVDSVLWCYEFELVMEGAA
ncbi:MAG: hypothetical protein KGD60_13825 [Candidatus Thorarchaeota archaeon]|nr:hypothetical protein [Candidatus Thorarchaeota archaeon]